MSDLTQSGTNNDDDSNKKKNTEEETPTDSSVNIQNVSDCIQSSDYDTKILHGSNEAIYEHLVKMICNLDIKDDCIAINRKTKSIELDFCRLIRDDDMLNEFMEYINERALDDADTAIKFAISLTTQSTREIIIKDTSLHVAMLKLLERNFHKANEMRLNDKKRLYNSITLLGEYYHRLRLLDNHPITIIGESLLKLLIELLNDVLNINDENLSQLVLQQITLNGKILRIAHATDLNELLFLIRRNIIEQTVIEAKVKAQFMMTLDLFYNNFSSLDPKLEEFYTRYLIIEGQDTVNINTSNTITKYDIIHNDNNEHINSIIQEQQLANTLTVDPDNISDNPTICDSDNKMIISCKNYNNENIIQKEDETIEKNDFEIKNGNSENNISTIARTCKEYEHTYHCNNDYDNESNFNRMPDKQNDEILDENKKWSEEICDMSPEHRNYEESKIEQLRYTNCIYDRTDDPVIHNDYSDEKLEKSFYSDRHYRRNDYPNPQPCQPNRSYEENRIKQLEYSNCSYDRNDDHVIHNYSDEKIEQPLYSDSHYRRNDYPNPQDSKSNRSYEEGRIEQLEYSNCNYVRNDESVIHNDYSEEIIEKPLYSNSHYRRNDYPNPQYYKPNRSYEEDKIKPLEYSNSNRNDYAVIHNDYSDEKSEKPLYSDSHYRRNDYPNSQHYKPNRSYETDRIEPLAYPISNRIDYPVIHNDYSDEKLEKQPYVDSHYHRNDYPNPQLYKSNRFYEENRIEQLEYSNCHYDRNDDPAIHNDYSEEIIEKPLYNNSPYRRNDYHNPQYHKQNRPYEEDRIELLEYSNSNRNDYPLMHNDYSDEKSERPLDNHYRRNDYPNPQYYKPNRSYEENRTEQLEYTIQYKSRRSYPNQQSPRPLNTINQYNLLQNSSPYSNLSAYDELGQLKSREFQYRHQQNSDGSSVNTERRHSNDDEYRGRNTVPIIPRFSHDIERKEKNFSKLDTEGNSDYIHNNRFTISYPKIKDNKNQRGLSSNADVNYNRNNYERRNRYNTGLHIAAPRFQKKNMEKNINNK